MAFPVLLALGLLALSMAATYYLRPDTNTEKLRAASLSDFGAPRAVDGDALPIVYGTMRLKSPSLVWFGDLASTPIMVDGGALSADQLVGYRYDVSMRLILCRGNAPVSETGQFAGARFVALYIGDKKVRFLVTGEATYGFAAKIQDDDAPGGDFQGYMYFYRGRWDQQLMPSSVGTVGNPIDRGATPEEAADTTPPYRGQVMLSLRQWYCAQPSLPLISVVLTNPIAIPGYETETAPIGADQANPAAVIYDLLTNAWGGVGSSTSDIDLPSFAAVAETLRDEQHGISIALARTTDARQVIEDILRQIDGVLYQEPSTRKYVLRLIREDYTLGLLPILDESNIEGQPRLTSSMWSETVNEVRVIWTNPDRDYADATAAAQDLANVNAQGGRRRSSEFRYPGVQSFALAAYLATRELNFLSRPIMKLELTVSRYGATLRPGDAFRFQWSAWGIDAVFRVTEPKVGSLVEGAVTFIAVQDRFSVAGTLQPPADSISDGDIPAYPTPILLRTITEAPRWVQLKAFEAGTLANVDAQRSYSVAWPEGADDRYRVDLDDAGDLSARAFPGRFELDDVYLRTQGPYDTTGIQIRAVSGWTPASATATQIATEGRNLIQIDGEILAFETATFVSGSTWTLDNVWRGVLDTVPADHAEGTAGYVLGGPAGSVPMGSTVLVHGTSYEARTLAAAGSTWTPAAESPTDALVATSRVRRPYPVDNLTVNGSQSPAELSDDGVTMTWAKRDRTKGTITRPDTATETPEAGTAYHAVGYKGTGPLDGGTQVTLQAGIASGTTRYPLGAVGHGTLEVGVDSALAVTLPDGTTPTLTAWQVPTLEVVAPRHRNLIINGKFDDGTNNWTTSGGTASAGSGAGSLGGGGTMITAAASTTTLTFYQDIPIQGYSPADLRALLTFAAGPTAADANDTFEVTVTSRDASNNVLDTASIAATHPAAWDRYSVEIANLDPDTATIRVSFTIAIATSGDGGDTHVDIGVTECRLRVGDFTGQLLSDAEFAALTAWSQTVGTWSIKTATLYGSAQYVRPDDGASAQLRQAITPAAGWERNATAELVCGRMNDDIDDTGTVTLQALDGGGTVIGSSTTGAEASTALGGTNVWAPRRLTLDLPDGTATVRVQLDAARVTGTPLNACFGDFDLRLHKELDPVVDLDHAFDSPPTQRLPASHAEWVSAWPNIAPPNAALYAGRANGELGGEPLLEVVGTAYTDGEFLCDEGRADGRLRSKAYDLAGGTIQVGAVGDAFMNFRSTENWCVVVAFKSDVWDGDEWGLASRVISSRGWELGHNASGAATATLYGTTTATATSAATIGDPGIGVLRMAAIHHDATADEVAVIDHTGATTASTAAIGEFRATTPGQATFGDGPSFTAFGGQIARIWAWRGTSTPTTAEIASLFTYATNPTGVADPYPRTGYVVTVDGSDADGLVGRGWPIGVAPHVLDEEIGTDLALVACPACTNLVSPDFATWTTVGGVVETIADPLIGIRCGRAVASASGDGIRSPTYAFGGAATAYFQVAYSSPDGTATFILEDNSGATVASHTLAVAATPTTTAFSLSWSGATAGNGKLRITSGSTGRAVRVSAVLYAGLVEPARRVFPIGTPGAVCPSVTVAPTTLYNAEGELYADVALVTQGTATIARVWNTSNANDNRQLRLVSGDLVGKHATSAASNTNATATLTLDTATRYQARLRWQVVGLRDGTASEWTSVRGEQGAVVDTATGRTATWTPSSTALTRVDVGHDGGTDVAAGSIARIRLRAREPRL